MTEQAETLEDQVAQKEEVIPSLLKWFTPREYPTEVDMWRIAVQIPEAPEESEGGIALPAEYRENKEFSSYIGMVRSMGPLCYQAVTRSGLDLADARKCKVGDWVQFGKHDGEKFRSIDGTLWVVLSDTKIIGVTHCPEQFDCMWL